MTMVCNLYLKDLLLPMTHWWLLHQQSLKKRKKWHLVSV